MLYQSGLGRIDHHHRFLYAEITRFRIAMLEAYLQLISDTDKLVTQLIPEPQRARLLSELLLFLIWKHLALIPDRPRDAEEFYNHYTGGRLTQMKDRADAIKRALGDSKLERLKAQRLHVGIKLTAKRNIVFPAAPLDDLSGLLEVLAQVDVQLMIDQLNKAQETFLNAIRSMKLRHLRPTTARQATPACIIAALQTLLEEHEGDAGSKGQGVVPESISTTDEDEPGVMPGL